MFRLLAVVGVLAISTLLGAPRHVQAQLDETAAWASHLSNTYRVLPNVTYHIANNRENKIDLYLPRDADGPTPVLMYIHGGGWRAGSKEGNILRLLPWLEKGWAVVNVQYRLANVSLAPAAVEDCLCALRWVIRNAEDYNIDQSRIVVTGNSAGGHLALTTGMIPASAGLDRECPGPEDLSVAAVINWYGITDVGDLLHGPNMKTYAVTWMGSMTDRFEIAERVSPLTYVRAGLPPILTIHGDADPVVPHQHATRLHGALAGVGVSSELHVVPGGGHGGFNRDETVSIFETIDRFLEKHGLGTGISATTNGGGQ
ncbi:MAG: lipase [Acidobacteria bacterium]|nr:lipase [Acidobacteriota bacterium]|tara:strand:- start:666 stop:1607 length:942 start_codon:yes stop_codon:yes gene_type:complete